MGKFLDGAKKAADTGKKGVDAAKKGKHAYDKTKDVANNAYENGIENVAADEAKGYGKRKGTEQAKKLANKALKKPKAMAKKAAKKLAMKSKLAAKAMLKMKAAIAGAKALFLWLITPIMGWVVSFFLIIGGLALLSSMDDISDDFVSGDGSGYGDVTRDEYAALQNGCPSNTLTGGPSSSLSFEGNTTGWPDWTLEDVSAWMTSPVSTTWGVDLDDAEAFFLTRNASVAANYGVTASNIREVSQAVQEEGVSPQFFWMYAVEEGGGEGGYINHFTPANASSDRIEAARNDAQRIVDVSNWTTNEPAEGNGISPSMPLGPALEVLDQMPQGSIGRAYLMMTAAATAEIVHLNGQPGAWSPMVAQEAGGGFGTYGPPLSKMMTMIQSLGGDPFSDTQMVNLSGNNVDCDDPSQGNGQLISGGMNLEEAIEFMRTYHEAGPNFTADDILPAATGKPEIHINCTAFVSWFLNNYTELQSQGGDGGDIVPNMVDGNPNMPGRDGYDFLEYSDVPTVYGLFSVRNRQGMTTGPEGHTGVILGIDTERNTVVIGHSLYNSSFTRLDDPGSGVNAMEVSLDYFDEEGDWTFVDISDHLTIE